MIESSLALTAFEHYMLADDQPAYPMTFWLRLTFSGQLDPATFRASLTEALMQHWLLQAQVRGPTGGRTARLSWVRGDVSPTVFWNDHSCASRTPIDLYQECGLRAWVNTAPQLSRVLLQFHHACSDALGALAFIETLLRLYRAPLRAPRPLPSLDPSAARAHVRRSSRKQLQSVPAGLVRVACFFGNRPRPIAGDRHASAPGSAPFCSRILDADWSARLIGHAKSAGVTVNDWLLRDLFLTLANWNRRHGSTGVLRLAMPMNLRPTLDMLLPAMNVAGMVFIDRKMSVVGDVHGLLAGIARETRHIKEHGTGETFLQILRLAGTIPGGMAHLLRSARCTSTAVLSNLGIVLPNDSVASDLAVQSVEFFPPIRPLVRAAFGVLTHAGRLSIGLHYDPRAFYSEQANALLNEYVEQLARSQSRRT